MFTGAQITEFSKLLKRRRVWLFHACQYQDYCSYLHLGGVPSRKLMAETGSEFTAFETDKSDHERGVWDKVFVNLADFGDWFANGYQATPNAYGPIQLVIDPDGLIEAQDIALCLRSAGALGYQRSLEALKDVGEAEKLFLYPPDSGAPKSAWVKFGKELQDAFADEKATGPEISCTFANGKIDLKHVRKVIVDPYVFSQHPLRYWVIGANRAHGRFIRVVQRVCEDESRALMYRELENFLVGETASLQLSDLAANPSASQALRNWSSEILGKDMAWQFNRYAKYLFDGTVIPLEVGI